MMTLSKFFVPFFMAALFNLVISIAAFSEEYIGVKKITLGKFEARDSDIPFWKEIDRRYIAIDDSDRIYVLNRKNNEILIYSDTGKQVGHIRVKHKIIDDDGRFEVSGDGNSFFLLQRGKGYVLGRNGEIIKTTTENIYTTDVTWRCDGRFITGYWETIFRPSDAKGNYFVCGKDNLQNCAPSGAVMWEKQIHGCRGIVGIDKD